MKKWMYAAIIALLLLLMGAVIGWNIRKNNFKCPEISTHTVFIHDTVLHEIPTVVPYYITKVDSIVYRDTVEVSQKVDTALILKDYFAKHYYTREWTDDTILYVKQRDMVSENKIYPQEFEYKILKPQTINQTTVNNITYNRYLTGGITIPLKDINSMTLDVRYNWVKGYIGAVYYPKSNAFGVSLGATLFKFKSVNTK